ncbi:RNA polymerase sigma-54 factor, partial [Erysipelatoclostridium ramosum]|nr:RNA polymerase sigma-54 factor [Thomasclavelia ramosa]
MEENEIHIQMFRKTYGLRMQAPVKDADADTAKYLSQQQKQAEALLGSIEKRNSTMERIMEVIAVVQQDFFLQHGQ